MVNGSMKIIVTGGAGFIGSAVCRHLVREVGADVLNIDKLTYAANLESLASIRTLHNQLSRPMSAIAQNGRPGLIRPDAVIHLAAESHVDRSSRARRIHCDEYPRTYVLLEAARLWSSLDKVRPMPFASCMFRPTRYTVLSAQMGCSGDHALRSAPYSASKAASDHLVVAWHRTYGLPCLISNSSNNYGPTSFGKS